MANKTGDSFYCESCGAEVVITKSCTCKECSITCCGKPMKPKQVSAPSDCGCRRCG